MELNEVFNIIEKHLAPVNEELGFKFAGKTDNSIKFSGDKGVYNIIHDSETNILTFDIAYEDNGDETVYRTISRSLLELENTNEKDARSASNEIQDEVEKHFKKAGKVDLDKVKMPKAVSRTKAKNGVISYDTDSLANRFGVLYPEYKDEIRLNIATYGEFLPEDFFVKHGTPKVLDVIKNGSVADQKKLFKMLGEVFEDGTNEVQDIIAVTILGEMHNDPEMMAVADKYMTEYMSGPVHEVNKLTKGKNRFTKKLENPPKYKPKKNKSFSLQNGLGN